MTKDHPGGLRMAWLAAVIAGACSGGKLAGTPSADGSIASAVSDYAGNWDGYVEAYTFSPDNSGRVRLTIGPDGQGTLQVGDGSLLAPPTDPNVGFPAGITTSTGSTGSGDLAEGFLYPIYATQVQTNRIQLGVNPADLEAGWCALQPPVATAAVGDSRSPTDGGSDGGDASVTEVNITLYNCLPTLGYTFGPPSDCAVNRPDGQSDPVDCDKLYLCNIAHACRCTESACAVPTIAAGTAPAQYPVELDGALDDSRRTLTATLNLGGTRVTAVLLKQ
jgi:hypothetical protein